MSPWIKWALAVEKTAQARTLIDVDRGQAAAKHARTEMLGEIERFKLGFCDREVFQRYLETSS